MVLGLEAGDSELVVWSSFTFCLFRFSVASASSLALRLSCCRCLLLSGLSNESLVTSADFASLLIFAVFDFLDVTLATVSFVTFFDLFVLPSAPALDSSFLAFSLLSVITTVVTNPLVSSPDFSTR